MKMLQVYTDFIEDLEPLTDEEVGRLFRAMLQYAADEVEPMLTGNERITWATARKHLKAQWSEYRKMCERNRENITRRYESVREDTSRNKNKNKNNTRTKQEQYISIERENLETIKQLTEAM